MEIDITKEVSGPKPGASHDRFRGPVLVIVALGVGLVGGGLAGAAFGRQSDAGGAVVFTGADLRMTGRVPALQWGLANFSPGVATVDSVLIDGRPAEFGPPDIPGKSVAEFTTPLRCDSGPPQLSIVVVNGDGNRNEVGYLVEKPEWKTFCG